MYLHGKTSPSEIPTNYSIGMLWCVDSYQDTWNGNFNPDMILRG